MWVVAVVACAFAVALTAVTALGLRFAARTLLLEKLPFDTFDDKPPETLPVAITMEAEARAVAAERSAAELRARAAGIEANGSPQHAVQYFQRAAVHQDVAERIRRGELGPAGADEWVSKGLAKIK